MGLKKIRKQRHLDTEEHCKIESNHYHDCELQKLKRINPMNPHRQNKQTKPQKINNKKQTIIKTTQIKINRKIKNQYNKLQSQQSNQ